VLQERGAPVPRTHDLAALARAIAPPLPDLAVLAQDLDALSALGVEVRYPGFVSTAADAGSAMAVAARVRKAVRNVLGLAA
jgi:HEPN domain-containing protein